MNEAESSGLRFVRVAREEARWRANPHGEQYDSRSGIAGYYRYGPRKVRELCEDTEHGVKVVRVNVHPAVFERIERHQVEYAPVSLDRPFDVLGGQVLGGQGQKPDTNSLEVAWDVVWWRRLAYFTTVGLTLFVGLFILRLVWSGADRLLRAVENPVHSVWSFVTGPLSPVLAGSGSGLRRVEDAVLDHVPGWLSPLLGVFCGLSAHRRAVARAVGLVVFQEIGRPAGPGQGARRMGLGRAKSAGRAICAETQLAQPRGATWAGGDGHGLALLPQPHRASCSEFRSDC